MQARPSLFLASTAVLVLALAALAPATLDAGGGEERPRAPQPSLGRLQNGDFSIVIDGRPAAWNVFGPDPSPEGAGAVRLPVGSAGINWLAQTVPVAGGGAYEVRAVLGGSGSAVIRVSWHATGDGSGGPLGSVQSGPPDASGIATTGPFAIPGDARSLRVRLVAEGAAGSSAVFGSVTLAPSTAPAPIPQTQPETSGPVPAEAPPAVSTTTGRRPVPVLPTVPGPRAPRSRPVTTAGTTAAPAPAPVVGGMAVAPVKVNEIAFDEGGVLWVELYNAGPALARLDGWSLAGPGGAVILPPMALAGHSFVVGRVGTGLDDAASSAPVAFETAADWGLAMSRAGGWIELAEPGGAAIDAVSWGSDASVLAPPPAAIAAHHSLERRPAGLDRNLAEDFVENAEPTPGGGIAFVDESSSTAWAEIGFWSAGAAAPILALLAVRALVRRRAPYRDETGATGDAGL